MENLKDPQVVDVMKAAHWGNATGRNHVSCTKTDRSFIALNCYEPGVNDEMHCHPGSDHTFFVVEGECTMKGLKEGEEVVVGKRDETPTAASSQSNNSDPRRGGGFGFRPF